MQKYGIDKDIYIVDEIVEKKNKEKFTSLYFLLDFWMQAMEEQKEIASFFIKNNYQNIAIYGMGAIGKHIKKQLEKQNFHILYSINRNEIKYNNFNYNLFKDINKIPKADVIVVTPIMEYKEIKEKLEKITSSKIISIEEVILSL